MYQSDRNEAVGKKIFDTFPQYQHTEEGKAILRVLQGEKVTLYNQPYDGKEGYYEINLIPLFDEQKQVIGGLGILHDVTERLKLEEERTTLKLKRQKDLLNAILEAQETERRRIAETLHNGLAQTLYAAKLNLDQMYIVKSDATQVKEAQDKASELLADAIKETRNISHELIPTILEDFGLRGAIDDICKKYAQSNFSIQAEIYGFEEEIDKYLEVALYRITQELANNVIKHAQASNVHIHLVQGGLGILLKVSDNGRGFNVAAVMQSVQGIGLKTIKDRVKLLNGDMDIKSLPGQGTTVTIKIPYS
jgi:signal transduction histidine kinase